MAFVFGHKATDLILNISVSQEIKTELAQATKYAEGRGIPNEVKGASIIGAIKKLFKNKIGKLEQLKILHLVLARSIANRPLGDILVSLGD